ncbi:MAG: hypothetical protein ACOCRO_00325 [Halanaerobiales bacterium]
MSSAVAIIPLTMFMTSITSKLASYIGNSWGGLLNVTFGNATELIISIFAILNGLLSVVKTEITGSIIMNLFLLPSIEGISRQLNISQTFIGVIILPLLANVAENYIAIKMARKNNIDMSINIAIGSSIQLFAFYLIIALAFYFA